MTFYNIATGQYLNECDFYALVKDTNYTCCSQSENVWIAQPNNLAFNEYQWQQYFLSHVPSCGSPYTLTLRYSAGNAPVQSLNDWNTQLAGNYTAVSVIGNDVILTGGSGVDIPASALIDSNLVQVTDDGSVNSMGDNCLAGGSIANLVLSAAVSVGNGLLGNCPLSNIELPACTSLGSTSGNDGIFTGISGQSISAIFNIALATNNAGQPDGDILDLYANNDVTTQWDTAPVNTVAPAITGTNSVGSVLTCSQGTWTYLGDITYAYQWRRGGSPIGGATALTYTTVSADAGTVLTCVVTATTSAGSANATSNNFGVIESTSLNLLLDASNTASYLSPSTTWTDVSGNTNNGTLTNGPTFSTDGGGCIQFDGVNDYVTIPDNALLKPPTTLTVTAWVKFNTFGANFLGILDKYNGPSNNGYTLDIPSSTLRRARFGAGFGAFTSATGTTTLSTGVWYHICGVINTSGSAYIRIYVNGVLENSAVPSGTISQNTEPLIIGGDGVSTNYANANIGFVSLQATALSTAQVLANFNATKSKFGY